VPDSVLGNFGQPLNHGMDHEDDDYNSQDLAINHIADVIDDISTPGEGLKRESEQPVAGPSRVLPSELADVEIVSTPSNCPMHKNV
jgi:hypothetical protein